jgi:hypothetical protein
MNPTKQCIKFQSLPIILDLSNNIFKSNDNKSISLYQTIMIGNAKAN